MALLSFVEKALRDEAPNLSLMADPAFDHANKSIFSRDWAKEVHVKTLETAVVPPPRLEFLAKLEWSVSVGPPGTFILGDLVVIRYSPKSGQFESSLEMKGKKRAILVPLSDRHLLVGQRRGMGVQLDYEALNRATAELCVDFFVSNRNTRREGEYAFSLGARCHQLWKETLAETERESLTHPRVTSRTPPTFPPCIADPEDPLPSLQRCVSIVAERVAAAQPVYFNPQMKGWIKRKMWTVNISCELQRPTAIPDTIGVVTFDCELEQSTTFSTREEAEAAVDFQRVQSSSGYTGLPSQGRVTYAIRDGKWVVERREHRSRYAVPMPQLEEWSLASPAEPDTWPTVLLLLF
jgi:hypothetical protein